MNFGYRLKELRTKRKITQQQLGDAIHVSKVSVSGYENNNRTPDTETLQLIADYFNVTTDYLLGRNHTPEWANKDEVMELDKLLESNIGMTYGPEEMTAEDREQINDLIASYFWVKKQKEDRKKKGKEN